MHGKDWLDLLHLIRQWSVYLAVSDPDALEEEYWFNLDDFRQAFTTACAKAIGHVDVIIDTPSTLGYHRPYLSSFRQLYPKTYWLMLGKGQPPEPPVAILGDSIRRKRVTTPNMHHILIVDDVYATGGTAGKIVDFLRTRPLPADVQFFIAAPLRIPAHLMQKKRADTVTAADLPARE